MGIYLKLFLIFLKIGAFSFGGGNAILSFISQEVVIKNKWLPMKEFTDLVAISQATPGPIAINGATYVGYRIAGFWGSVTATLALIIPSIIIMLIFTKFFLKFRDNKYLKNAFSGLIPATIGLVAAAAVLISNGSFIDYKSFIIFAAVFIASYKYSADPIVLTIVSGLIGLILYR